jgi:hypothetical protein
MQTIKFKITGIAPLLMHNNRTVDRFDPITKKLKEYTSKSAKSKTDDDELALRRLEWEAGLYLDENGPCLTADTVLGMVISGAKKSRQGKQAAAGVYETSPTYSLQYTGPRTADELYAAGRFEDCRTVRIGDKSIMRTRPRFSDWSCVISLHFDETMVDRSVLLKALEDAGERIGICDYRPRFGRFLVTVLD